MITDVKTVMAGLSIDCFPTPVYQHTDVSQNLPRAGLSFIIGLRHAPEDWVCIGVEASTLLEARTQHWPFDSSLLSVELLRFLAAQLEVFVLGQRLLEESIS